MTSHNSSFSTPRFRVGLSRTKKTPKPPNPDVLSPLGKGSESKQPLDSKNTPLKPLSTATAPSSSRRLFHNTDTTGTPVSSLRKPVDTNTSLKPSRDLLNCEYGSILEKQVEEALKKDEKYQQVMQKIKDVLKEADKYLNIIDKKSDAQNVTSTKSDVAGLINKATEKKEIKDCDKKINNSENKNNLVDYQNSTLTNPNVEDLTDFAVKNNKKRKSDKNNIEKPPVDQNNTLRELDVEDSTDKTIKSGELIKKHDANTDKHKHCEKPSIFRKQTSTNKNKEKQENSPVRLGQFTTSEWLDEEEFRILREKEFNWKIKTQNEKKDEDSSSSDSEKEIFRKKIRGSKNNKRKRNLQVIESSSSSDEKECKSPILSSASSKVEVDSDDDFSKEPIKIRKKGSKILSIPNLSTKSVKTLENVKNTDHILTSKKLKKDVTVIIEKLSDKDVKYGRNNETTITQELKNNDVDKDEIISNNPEVNSKKENQQLLDVLNKELNAMKATVEKKEQFLASLKQAEIYMEKHDPQKLEVLSNIWLNGCRLAIEDLLQLLKQHGPITMKSLLTKLQIAPEILDKLQISAEED